MICNCTGKTLLYARRGLVEDVKGSLPRSWVKLHDKGVVHSEFGLHQRSRIDTTQQRDAINQQLPKIPTP